MTASLPAPTHDMPAFVTSEEARLLMAVKLYEMHRVTLGQAAEMVGYSKRGFMDVLGQFGISVADYPAEELAGEIAW